MVTTAATTCRHHWLLQPPNGATSEGRCKHCGTTRTFRNSSDFSVWDTSASGPEGDVRGFSLYRRREYDEPDRSTWAW